MKLKVRSRTLVLAIALVPALGLLTGCSSYAEGEIVSVEDDMGQDGPVKELEVVRTAIQNTMSQPDTYEVHVSADNENCQVGRIYPACDDKDKDNKSDYLESLQDDSDDDND